MTVACTSRATVELAAARGLPMLLGMHIGDEEKADLVGHYRKAAAAAGGGPDSVPHVSAVLGYVADDRERALAEVREAMPGWLTRGLGEFVPIDDRPRSPTDPDAYTELLCSLHPVGSPRQVVERLRISAERTGIQHVIMMVEGAGSTERTLANIARLGSDVLPHLA